MTTEHPLAGAFRGPGPAEPWSRVLRKPNLFVGEFGSDAPNLVITGSVPQDDAYVVTMHLRRRPNGAMCAEGRWIDPSGFVPGNAGIVDLRMNLVSEYAGPFHYVSLYLPRRALDEVTDDAGIRRIADLRHRPGVGFQDPVLRHLLLSLRPALAAGSDAMSTLYADHVAMAFITHMANTYGEARLAEDFRKGGLTPSQSRRAKELLDSRLDGDLPLAELASVCQLSVRHFARAFRMSTGQSPHRWLTERRLEKARDLLESSAQPLREVAKACGFANQSHFNRVFARAMGVSPGAWRRLRRT